MQKEKIEIGLVGMSHKTAAVETRELFAMDDAALKEFQDDLCRNTEEAAIVMTCNRIEVYFASKDADSSVETVIKLLERKSSLPRKKFADSIYKKNSKDAVAHLFSVASSLDSMVVGENEILGQIKDAYRKAAAEKRTGQILNRLFHQAFKTAKRVKTETEIAKNPLSIAYIATELARRIFDDFSKRSALLIGAGEMGELILKYLTKYNIGSVTIANRSYHNAERIANEINVKANIISLDEIKNNYADIIISSAYSPGHLITVDTARAILKNRATEPVFMIDISVPRNIDPEAARLNNIFLYNIDDLKSIAEENLKSRLKEVELAQKLIEIDADEFYEWYEGLDIVPAIVSIQDKFNDIRQSELARYRGKKLRHLSEDDFKIIEELTTQIMTKTMHNPIMYLKEYENCAEHEKKTIKESAKLIQKIFGKNSKS